MFIQTLPINAFTYYEPWKLGLCFIINNIF